MPGIRNKQIRWDSQVDLNGQPLDNIGAPIGPSSAARVQDAGARNWKEDVIVATVADWDGDTVTFSFSAPTLTISGLSAGSSRGLIDSQEPVDDDRVLIKDATEADVGDDAALNGIWVVTGGTTTSLTLERPADADSAEDIHLAVVGVLRGTSKGLLFVQTEEISTFGTDPILWDSTGSDISSIEDRLDILEAGEHVSTLAIGSIAPGSEGTLVEVGATVTDISFTAAHNQTLNSVVLNPPPGDSFAGVNEPIPLPATAFDYAAVAGAGSGDVDTFTETTINATKQFSISATDEFGRVSSPAVTITWSARVYVGNAVPGTIDETFIEALAQDDLQKIKNGSYQVVAGSGEKIYFCYPDSFGLSKFTVNGFTGGFTDEGTVVVNNSEGVAITYRVYSSDNEGLGDTTFEVTDG